MVTEFKGDNFFLHTAKLCNFQYDGFYWESIDVAFDYARVIDKSNAYRFLGLNSCQSKLLANSLPNVENWDSIKLDVMYELNKCKFLQNRDLMDRLCSTDYYLANNNSYGDSYWGIHNGVGKNYLGLILMLIRKEYEMGELV